MDTTHRTLVKSLTWQALGLVLMTLIGFIATGSWSSGGVIALTTSAISLVTYVLHERFWARIRWGRQTLPPHG